MEYASLKALSLRILLLVIAPIVTVFALMFVLEIGGAVVANGRVTIDGETIAITSPTGGVIERISVRDGDSIEEGEVLVEFDKDRVKSELGVVEVRLTSDKITEARLLAEKNKLDAVDYPSDIVGNRELDFHIRQAIESETSLFALRSGNIKGEQDKIREQIRQNQDAIAGYRGQMDAYDDVMALTKDELELLEPLLAKGHTTISRVLPLKRQLASAAGTREGAAASIASLNAKIAELELELNQVEKRHLAEVESELRDVQSRIQQMSEARIGLEARLREATLRAPSQGKVQKLKFYAAGTVVLPGATLMEIVPADKEYYVEAYVSPDQIDRVNVGQQASVRFTAFDARTTPELDARVIYISPTSSSVKSELSGGDPVLHEVFVVRLAVLNEVSNMEISDRIGLGMVSEVFISTESRSILSYLIKPLLDQVKHAFRER